MKIPVYNPNRFTLNKAERDKKYYRNTCSGFGTKAKPYVLERDGEICVRCGSTENLQIDHIISACYGFYKKIDLYVINNVDNLRILCKTCNATLQPMDIVYFE